MLQKLMRDKFDQKAGLALGLRGILVRDFKNYTFANSECSVKLGLSVSINSIEDIVECYTFESLCKEIELFMELKELSMMGILCHVVDVENHTTNKHCFMYTKHQDAFANSFDALSQKVTDYVQSEPPKFGSFGNAHHVYWRQINSGITRKKFEEFLKKFYSGSNPKL
jgi:hypothetical protein